MKGTSILTAMAVAAFPAVATAGDFNPGWVGLDTVSGNLAPEIKLVDPEGL